MAHLGEPALPHPTRRQLLGSTLALAAGSALTGCAADPAPSGSTGTSGAGSRVRFAPELAFGVASAAYQIEGTADRAGRTASIWDTFCAQDGRIDDGSSAVESCDHYHQWADDLDLMQKVNVQTYRLSLSWSRLMPDGTGRINRRGRDFYKALIDGLNQRSISPMVTLYHWDLPQILQDKGGWENRDSAAWFADYAATAFREFDGVDAWLTINEPKVIARQGYLDGTHAPGRTDARAAGRVIHHLGLAHGRAVEAFRASSQQATIGPCVQISPCYPVDDSAPAAKATELLDVWENTLYLDPILKKRYPELTDELDPAVVRGLRGAERDGDLNLIGAPVDFLGVSYFTPTFVTASGDPQSKLPTSSAGWQQIYPDGLYDVLRRLAVDYPIEVKITANGVPDDPSQTPPGDDARIDFHREHLAAVQRAIEAGSKVSAYYAWSFLDAFEWNRGYTQKWGLIQVDFDDKARRRVIKNSARWYAQVIADHALPS